ncbi:MAG: hypothetical protein ACRDMA_02360 [Solirubrobacterales bacterium]
MRRGANTLVALGTLCLAVLAVPALAQADFRVVLGQKESADPVRPGDLETYTVTVRNVGSDTLFPDFTVELAGFAPGSSRAVNNPYRSVTPSQGGCVITNTDAANPGEHGYKWTDCTLGSLAPGKTATIKAVVEMNESMDHWVDVLYGGAQYNFPVFETTTVSTPATLSGSKKIRVKGLPDGCVRDDFELKVRAKASGVKKMVAALEGDKLDTVKAKRIKVDVPVADLEPGFHELKLSAKREHGSKLKATVTFQRC